MMSVIEVSNDHFDKNKLRESLFQKENQMIAHDIRKSFGQMELLIQMINSCNSLEELEEIRDSIVPDVRNTVCFGKELSDEILNSPTSARKKRSSHSVSIVWVLKTILNDIFKFNVLSDIAFEYDLKHEYFVKVNKIELTRIFSNLLMNAMEAMHFGGRILIKTSSKIENSIPVTEFSIINNGSFIPASDLDEVFNDTYTKGKENGHGLGLAIVKNIVNEHGGDVVCRSEMNEAHQSGLVEFTFTLPSEIGRSDRKMKESFCSQFLDKDKSKLNYYVRNFIAKHNQANENSSIYQQI